MSVSDTSLCGGLNFLGRKTFLSLIFVLAIFAGLASATPSDVVYVDPTPANGSFRNYNYSFINITFTDANDTCLLDYVYPNSTEVNLTMTLITGNNSCYFNVTEQGEGQANFTVYVNDTQGLLASNLSYYYFTVDRTNPASVAYVSPSPANRSSRTYAYAYINVTFTETNPDTCLLDYTYPNSTEVNLTMTRSGSTCYFNVTNQSSGVAIFKVYLNDSAGHWGSNLSYYSFNVLSSFVVTDLSSTSSNFSVGNTSAVPTYALSANVTALAPIYSSDGPIVVSYYMPYGVYNTSSCNGTGEGGSGFRVLNWSTVVCHMNLTVNISLGSNITSNITVSPNISAFTNFLAAENFWIAANASGNGSLAASSPQGRYGDSYSVNPRIYALNQTNNTGANTTLKFSNWNLTDSDYNIMLPIETYNATAGRPEMSNNTFGDLVYLNTMGRMERPTFMRLWSFNLTFGIFNTNTSALDENLSLTYVIRSPVNNTLYSNQTLAPLLVYSQTQTDPFDNTSWNMTMGTPSPYTFTVYVNGTPYNSTTLLSTYAINITSDMGEQSSSLGLINLTNSTAYWLLNKDVSILYTLMSPATSAATSPVHVEVQNLSGWDMNAGPAFGDNVTMNYTIVITNSLNNYTVNSLKVRQFVPINASMNMSNQSVVNFTMSSGGNMTWYNGSANGTQTVGVTTNTSCMSVFDNSSRAPTNGSNITICMATYDLELVGANFGFWSPNSNNSNATVNFIANLSFPTLNESNYTPNTAGSTNTYNVTFQSSTRTKMNLTAKVPGLSSTSTGVSIRIDGSALTSSNYTVGSLYLNDVDQGQHVVEIQYSVPSNPTPTPGGYSTPTPSASATPTASTPGGGSETPGGGAGTPTPASATPTPVPTPTVTPRPSATPTASAAPYVGAATSVDAGNAISEAASFLNDAVSRNLDVSQAQSLLQLAQEAYDRGDFTSAKQYADQAKALLQEKLSASQVAAGGDWTWLMVGLLIVILGIAYWYSKKNR